MDRLLQLDKLDTYPSSCSNYKDWFNQLPLSRTISWSYQWKDLTGSPSRQTLNPRIFEYIEHCTIYKEAIPILKVQYVKPAFEIFIQHILAVRRQKSGETLEMFLQVLKSLPKVYSFQNVTET